MDRPVWRSALEAGNYELLCSDGRENGGMNGRVEAMEVDSPAHLRARDRYSDTGAETQRHGGRDTEAKTWGQRRRDTEALVPLNEKNRLFCLRF